MGITGRVRTPRRRRQEWRRTSGYHEAASALRDGHRGSRCQPYGCDYGILPTDPAVLELAAPVIRAAVACGDLKLVAGPEVKPRSPWRTHRRTDAGEFLWAVVGPGIERDAAEWLARHLDAELQGNAASDEAWKLVYVFCEERWGPGPDQVIVLTGTPIHDDRDVCNMLHFEAQQGFDRVLSARGTSMVDPDTI